MSIPIIQFSINPVFVVKFPPHEDREHFTSVELKVYKRGATSYERI